MSLKKHLKRLSLKIGVFLLIVACLFVPNTMALFSDTETSSGNIIDTGTIDMEVYADQATFVPNADSLDIGETTSRDFYIQNVGENAFNYMVSYEFVSGDEDLCQGLQLNGVDLPDFVASPAASIAPGTQDHLLAQVTFPADRGWLLEKTCTFRLNFRAWQPELNPDTGFTDEEYIDSTISTRDRCPDGDVVEVNPVDRLNLGDELSDSLHDISGWSTANLPGNYGGGDDGTYRQVIEESLCNEAARTAGFKLHAGTRKVNLLTLKVLDGMSNQDSFNVYVNGDLVGSYTDNNDSVETWETVNIPLNNLSGLLEVELEATGDIWPSCSTYGQLAVSWAEISGWFCSPDESVLPKAVSMSCDNQAEPEELTGIDVVNLGDTSSETGHNLIGWSTANLAGNYGAGDDGTYRQIVSENYCADDYRVAGFDLDAGPYFANLLNLRVLDGISNEDDVDIYINDEFTARLADLTTNHTEIWQTYEIPLNNLSGNIKVRLVATDDLWPSCSTYGQVAVSWAQIDGFSCSEDQGVVLNEVLYDPTGDEDANMPDGEWVELYNNSDIDVDVNGWYIQNDADHTITISTANSDNNSNTSDGGETVVLAHGWLVVYMNGAILNNSGDTVFLYDPYNVLVDQVSYSNNPAKLEGDTLARSPDGTGAWVDPIATPCSANQLREESAPQTVPTPTPTISSVEPITLPETKTEPENTPTPTPTNTPTPTPSPSPVETPEESLDNKDTDA